MKCEFGFAMNIISNFFYIQMNLSAQCEKHLTKNIEYGKAQLTFKCVIYFTLK